MHGDIGDGSNRHEDTELVDAEPAREDGERQKLGCGSNDEAAARSGIGHDHRQERLALARFSETFRCHPDLPLTTIRRNERLVPEEQDQ
ncbi:hypothetical protein D3C86_1926840 [compost metagenome]